MMINSTTGIVSYQTDYDSVTPPDTSIVYPFKVEVVDNYGGTRQYEYTLTINDTNQAPVIEDIKLPRTIPELVEDVLNVSVIDPDGDELGIGTTERPRGVNFTKTQVQPGEYLVTFTWTPTEEQGPGNYSFILEAIDPSGESAQKTITYEVLEVNLTPEIDPAADITINEGQTVYLTPTRISDPDIPQQTLTLSADLSEVPGASFDPSTGTVTWATTEADGPGSYDVSVTVSDGELSMTGRTTITVLEVNTPPVLAEVGDYEVFVGDTLSFTLSATDEDLPPNTLTYKMSLELGTLDPKTGVFSFIPTAAEVGTYTVAFYVEDGEGGVDKKVSVITVIKPEIETTAIAKPEVFKLSSKGVFTVFLEVPMDIPLDKIDLATGKANGAAAKSVKLDIDDHRLILKFDRQGFDYRIENGYAYIEAEVMLTDGITRLFGIDNDNRVQ
jgi:hypothetical protein